MSTAVKTYKDEHTELFDQYYQTVFNAVYTKVGNPHDTEDISQEVFIALYKNLRKIENVKKWLFGTLKNIVLKFYRDREPDKQDIDEIFGDISLTFVNGFRDARIMISEAIEEEIKDEEERQMIDMIAFNNYSYAHVAKLLGLTKRAVQYRYGQLVKRILENLSGRGVHNIEDLL